MNNPIIQTRKKGTTHHTNSPSPPRPVGKEEHATPFATTPFSPATTVGRERRDDFNPSPDASS
jgi:hypothetical protein